MKTLESNHSDRGTIKRAVSCDELNTAIHRRLSSADLVPSLFGGAQLERTKIYCRLQCLIHKAHTLLIFHKFFQGFSQLEIILLCVRRKTQRNKSLTQLEESIFASFFIKLPKRLFGNCQHDTSMTSHLKLFDLAVNVQIVNCKALIHLKRSSPFRLST